MNLPRNRQGFYFSFSESGDKSETLEEIFQQLEMSQRNHPRSLSESAIPMRRFESEELRQWFREKSLGDGASGVVDLMRDRNGNRYAVKKMRLTNRREANRQIVRDLEYMLRAVESYPVEYIVRFHGYARRTFEAWIMMEVMDSCFGKLLTRLSGRKVPEDIVGALTASVVKALNHLKDKHNMIHRDVRPTNILVDRRGNIKLCDFGISRVLVNSMALTADAGHKYYLAPERVFAAGRDHYGIKSDVWSLGVTLVELARGRNPYTDCEGEFAAGQRILSGPSPTLPSWFSPDAQDFVRQCLQQEVASRPDYHQLMRMSFFRKYEHFDPQIVGKWVSEVLREEGSDELTTC